MRTHLILIPLLLLLTVACGEDDGEPRIRWKDVEAARTASEADPSSLAVRQHYIDVLTSYQRSHPADDEASRLFLVEEVAYARALVERGRFAAAIPYLEDAVARAPHDLSLQAELDEIRGRITVERERFEQLSTDMTPDEVRDLLGPPRPGWTHEIDKSGRVHTTWYYKRTDGGIASVSFVNDTVHLAVYGEILDLD